MDQDKKVIDPIVDYDKIPFSGAMYTQDRIVPQNGIANVVMTTSGGNEIIYELPSVAFNLSKSVFKCQIQTSAGGAQAQNVLYANAITPFRQVQLYTKSGLFLADINEFCNFSHVTMPYSIPLEDFKTMSTPSYRHGATGSFGAAGVLDGVWQGICPSNLAGVLNVKFLFDPTTAAGSANAFQTGTKDFNELLYLFVPQVPCSFNAPYPVATQPVTGAQNAAFPYINMRLRMGIFKDSIFGIDKDLFFDEGVYLKFTLHPYTKMGFTMNTNNITVTSFAAAKIGVLGAVTLANCEFLLAREINNSINNALINTKRTTGYSLPIPIVTLNKSSVSGTSQSITFKVNRGHGIKLNKIYVSCYNSTELNTAAAAIPRALDNNQWTESNVADSRSTVGSKITSFYTTIDSIRRQQFDLALATQDDYVYNFDLIKNSVLSDPDTYYSQWSFLDNFDYCAESSSDEKANVSRSNLISGLDLSMERTYQFIATCVSGTYSWYMYVITTKMLNITPSGVLLS